MGPTRSTAPRRLAVLGTASQVPTKHRSHNGYVLFWDEEAVLLDPGEGTQRQMTFAGVSATDLTRIMVTHLHGDHSLGLAGVAQRVSLDRVPHRIPVAFPQSGARHVANLLDASVYAHRADLVPAPILAPGPVPRIEREQASSAAWRAVRLDHSVETFGYRLDEPDGVTMDPVLLAAAGIEGPAIGQLRRAGRISADGKQVLLAEVSRPRPGQSFAFCMDTGLCDGVHELADGVDLLVIESTYLDRDAGLAHEYGHLTARQAASIAAEHRVRTLVLSHFSQRYADPGEFVREAREVYDGALTVATDLDVVPVPPRRAVDRSLSSRSMVEGAASPSPSTSP